MNDIQDPDVIDMAAELTRPHSHRESYTSRVGETTWTRHHATKVPSLVDQLLHGTPGGDGASRGGGYESRPAARLEGLESLTWIDLEAARWLRVLGLDDPGDELEIVKRVTGPRGPTCNSKCWHRSCAAIRRGVTVERRAIPGSGTTACIRQLAALYPGLDVCGPKPKKLGCCTRHEVERDVRRWWTQARIVTGWDTPAWRPDSTCPNCSVRGALRVRLEERHAMCVECRETWDSTSYQVLATHVRTESEEAARASKEVPCAPRDDVVVELKAMFEAMCPRCGSSRCVNAIRATKRRLVTGEWVAL